MRSTHHQEVKLAESKTKLKIRHDDLKSRQEMVRALEKKIRKREEMVKLKKVQPAVVQPNYYCPFCRFDVRNI